MTVASRFRAMNTDIELLSPTPGADFERAADIVRRVFFQVERCLSRFLPNSELSALNASNGASFEASPLLFEAVSLAVRAAESTAGVFDPTILGALEDAGYDRSFEQMTDATSSKRRSSRATILPDYRAIDCDPENRIIRVIGGQRIDLGGIGKGLAVDRALESTGFLPARCVAAGGDLAARGDAIAGQGWSVALEDAGDGRSRSVTVRDAAIATSTTGKRHWQVANCERHHLIDPHTGRPSLSPLRSVTVVAPTCVQADVAAKTALLLGEDGVAFLERLGLHGIAVRCDGHTVHTSQWPSNGAGL